MDRNVFLIELLKIHRKAAAYNINTAAILNIRFDIIDVSLSVYTIPPKLSNQGKSGKNRNGFVIRFVKRFEV